MTTNNEIKSFILTNPAGDEVHITNYGARLTQWHTQVGNASRNIVLGFSNAEDYLSDTCYMGAIAGPYANRLRNAAFDLNDKTIQLIANEGINQLHGGPEALNVKYWACKNQNDQSVTLSCTLPDGYNGYPGDITVEVTYALGQKSELTIAVNVSSDKVTIASPTTHPYFNLNGDDSLVFGHQLQINAQHYTPLAADNIPTGEIVDVTGGAFDYQTSKTILADDELKGKIDNNFITKPAAQRSAMSEKNKEQAQLISSDNKLTMHVSSNYPAIQIYTSEFLAAPFKPFQGICLEPQFCPNSPNQANFPFDFTTPEKPLNVEIIYRLEK